MKNNQKTPQQIVEILHSIKDVRLNQNGDLEVKFNEAPTDDWESIFGYNHGSFTQQLLLLIEDELLNG